MCGEIATERLVLRRRRPDAVVQVRERGEAEPAAILKIAQRQRERDGIGAAGDRDDDTSPLRDHAVPVDGAENPGRQAESAVADGCRRHTRERWKQKKELVPVQGLEPRTPRI